MNTERFFMGLSMNYCSVFAEKNMNIAVAQSGGPTCAINASLAGVFHAGKKSDAINKVFASMNGIEGILSDRLIDLSDFICSPDDTELLIRTPSAALGSCRKKLPKYADDSSVYEKITDCFRRHDVGMFFYIGGNDSMDTVEKLSAYYSQNNVDIKVIGVPKTIDNDLCGTDHCPGFGSAAKYVAASVQEITRDSNVYSIPSVTIIETMGRHAGWLTAASACMHENGESSPHLIYLPETPFSADRFIEDVQAQMKLHKAVIAVVSEGVRTADGKFAAEAYQSCKTDAFGHTYLAGVGKYLEHLVSEQIGCKVRSIELNVMQRCSSHFASLTDITESQKIGEAAVEAALNGKTGCMMSFKRGSSSTYDCEITAVPVAVSANSEKFFPVEWINSSGNGVTQEAVDYVMPLIQGELTPIMKNGMVQHFSIN